MVLNIGAVWTCFKRKKNIWVKKSHPCWWEKGCHVKSKTIMIPSGTFLPLHQHLLWLLHSPKGSWWCMNLYTTNNFAKQTSKSQHNNFDHIHCKHINFSNQNHMKICLMKKTNKQIRWILKKSEPKKTTKKSHPSSLFFSHFKGVSPFLWPWNFSRLRGQHGKTFGVNRAREVVPQNWGKLDLKKFGCNWK